MPFTFPYKNINSGQNWTFRLDLLISAPSIVEWNWIPDKNGWFQDFFFFTVSPVANDWQKSEIAFVALVMHFSLVSVFSSHYLFYITFLFPSQHMDFRTQPFPMFFLLLIILNVILQCILNLFGIVAFMIASSLIDNIW